MLRNTGTNDRSFEERLTEAISQISVYAPEWTNYNPSEPGITILENLSLFETLQQNHINQMPEKVQAALLKMAGFVPTKGRSARLLLCSRGLKQPLFIEKGSRFKVGNMYFETGKSMNIMDSTLKAVYGYYNDSYESFEAIIDRKMKLSSYIFGKKPKIDSTLFLMFDSMPQNGEELICYVVNEESYLRNAFADKDKSVFADIEWSIYTQEGFKELNVRDNTGAFITSGEIRFRMPTDIAPAVYEETPTSGYCIRAVLKRADYDIAPSIVDIYSSLFEVWQLNTRSAIYSSSRATGIEISGKTQGNFYISVYCREAGEKSYRQYSEGTGFSSKGRHYDTVKLDNGRVLYSFDKEKYGFGPEKGRYAIRVLSYSEDIMRNYKIGFVRGYDNEAFELPVKNISVESFCIVAKRQDEKGEFVYDFVRPGYKEDGALKYHILERTGTLVIDDAGDFIGAELFMGSCALYRGDEGNIRQGLVLKCEDIQSKDVLFINPAKGSGGCFIQTLEQLRRSYVEDIDTPFAAVTCADYERLVMTTPGLCIGKVRAFMDENRQKVLVAVMPSYGVEEKNPTLTEDYRKRIFERIDERRLLTTKVEIVEPEYVRVNVRASVYVKRHYKDSYEKITEAIREATDYVRNSKRNFGEPLWFDEVFAQIERLSCVEYVNALSLRPALVNTAWVDNLNVYTYENCLFIPGAIDINLVS